MAMARHQAKLDELLPEPSPVGKTVLWGVLVAAIVTMAGGLKGLGPAVVCGVISVVLLAEVVLWRHRQWQKHQERPSQLEVALVQALETPVQKGMVRLGHFHFGSITQVGAPARVVITHPLVVQGLGFELVPVATRVFGVPYKVKKTRKKTTDKLVLIEAPAQEQKLQSPREVQEQKIVTGAAEVFGSGVKISTTWEEDTGGGDFLQAVEIDEVNGMDLALRNKRNQMITRMRTRLPAGNFTPEVDANADRVAFARSKPLPKLVAPPLSRAALLLDHQAYRAFEVPLALGPGGRAATWSPRKDAHLLIIGGTGGGKTIAEHGVIQALAQAAWRIWLIDGKRIEFTGYREWPNVEFLAQTVEAQIRLLHLAHETMEARYDLITEGQASLSEMDPIVVVIDEVTSLLMFIKQSYQATKVKGMPAKDPVLDWISNIARLGRTAKIHLVLGMQRPDAHILSGEMRDNIAARMSLGRLQSKEGSMMMWDNAAIGVQVPKHPGRGVSLIDGEPTQVQSTYTANPDPTHDDYHPGMVAAARPEQEIYGRKKVGAAIPTVADDGAETVTWYDLLRAPILDTHGMTVEMDPVSSEESRALRRQRPTGAQQDYVLQAVESFEDIDKIFSVAAAELQPGEAIGLYLLAKARALRGQPQPAPRTHPELPEPVEPERNLGISQQHYAPCTVNLLQEGARVFLEEIGEEVMLSSAEPSDDDAALYTLEGYTGDGELVSVELEGTEKVEAVNDEAADEDEFAA